MRFGVRTDSAEALDRLAERLPFGTRKSRAANVDGLFSVIAGGARGRVRRFNVLYADHLRLSRTLDFEELADRFEGAVNLFVAANAPEHVFVHAGAVGWKGRAIVIPGRSFSGKTSLVKAFLEAGAAYYSDEYAVFDRDGNVHPFLRPLSIRENGSQRGRKQPFELFGAAGHEPLPVGCVLATTYRRHARWRPKELTPGHGVLALLDNAVPARRRAEAVLEVGVKIMETARAIGGVRGEARRVVESVLREL